jgi:hypothetical protein
VGKGKSSLLKTYAILKNLKLKKLTHIRETDTRKYKKLAIINETGYHKINCTHVRSDTLVRNWHA